MVIIYEATYYVGPNLSSPLLHSISLAQILSSSVSSSNNNDNINNNRGPSNKNYSPKGCRITTPLADKFAICRDTKHVRTYPFLRITSCMLTERILE
jgi:hypothetical protein